MRDPEISEITTTAAILRSPCLDHVSLLKDALENLTLCVLANYFRIKLNCFIFSCSTNIEDCLCKRQSISSVYLLSKLFFPSAVNSHADTFFTAINTEILVSPVTVSFTSSMKRDIFRRAKLWYLLATLWPARNKAQERQNSLTQLYALKTTKKPPKPCTASHHMEIFIRGTSKGQKGAARHVLTFKWQEKYSPFSL